MRRLVELLDKFRNDPTNIGYWFLLAKYTKEEINTAIDILISE